MIARALTAALVVLCVGSAAVADTKDKDTADGIVDQMLALDPITYGGAEAQVAMYLVNDRGQQTERKVVFMSRRSGKTRQTYVRFLSPGDIAGTAFLGLQDGNDRAQHLYLPSLEKTRRISSSQRNSRFVGTDYSFADLDSRDLEDSTRKRLADEKVGNDDCFVVEVTPKASDAEYGRLQLWVSKKSMLPMVIKFFDGKGKERKRLIVKDARQVDKRWVIYESKMVDLDRQHSTVMKVESIKLRTDIPAERFTERELGRG